MLKIILSLFICVGAVALAADLKELQEFRNCEILLAGSDDQVARAFFGNYVAHYEDGLGVRGFMGGAIPNSPANSELAMDYGLIWWGMKWNFAATLEEAVEHRLKARALYEAKKAPFTDLIMAGQYFLGSEEELGLSFADDGKPVPVPAEKVRELIERGAFEIDYLGNAKFIPPAQLQRRVSLGGMTYNKVGHLPGNFGKNSISQSGWVAFKQHGIHDYSTWKHSSEAKKLKKLARVLADRGYTIKFNTDYEKMLNKIKNQKRSYREEEIGEDGTLVKGERKEYESHTSRYATESVFKSMLNLLNGGKGYSVGLYNERDELVAGEIGLRSGNHLYGDSVFYDEVEHAKIAALALFEVLDAAGMPYSDPGMITRYTASMGAELVPFEEYLTKIKSGPSAPIALPALWDPRAEADVETVLGEIVKRKTQGLGNMKITRRTPVVNGDAVTAVAERLGLVRAELNLVFVSSPEEARAHIASATWADMPIYIEGVSPEMIRIAREVAPRIDAAAVGPYLSTLDFLRAALTGPSASNVSAYFIGSARHPDARKPVPLKGLIEVLELGVNADMPIWQEGTTLPSMTVNGWGFKATR